MQLEAVAGRPSGYEKFRILVDDPADRPALGFPDYADAFAEIVCGSPPRFAVGIFGTWGSGKTTLMRAIWARIQDRDDVIPVWFNAWRYEREQDLVIPLLDVLREALQEWAAEQERSASLAERARRAASALGAAAHAIAAGVSVSARLPGGIVEATLDLEKVMAGQATDGASSAPVSLYHASFRTMADAVQGFVTAGGRRRRGHAVPPPQRRLVVFVDDLDRCLPLNALSVLESMKLFFDLEGFVFVAGLDQQVIERAIEINYADTNQPPAAEAGGAAQQGITGRDYIKKIFQVPFGLPSVDRSQLDELVSGLVDTERLPAAQQRELKGRILRHLSYFSDEAGINPREVKRLVNADTLQSKLLSLKLGDVDRDSILALQIMAFRPDWERIWRRLEADPDGFVGRLNEGLERTRDADTVWVDGEPLPPRFVDYVSKGPAKSLLTNKRLTAYLSSSQASHTTDPGILKAQAAVDALRRLVNAIDESTNRAALSVSLHEKLDPLRSSVPQTTWGKGLLGMISRIEEDVSALTDDEPNASVQTIADWVQGFRARLDRLDTDLRNLRERYSLRT